MRLPPPPFVSRSDLCLSTTLPSTACLKLPLRCPRSHLLAFSTGLPPPDRVSRSGLFRSTTSPLTARPNSPRRWPRSHLSAFSLGALPFSLRGGRFCPAYTWVVNGRQTRLN